jgi:hypothetical protein
VSRHGTATVGIDVNDDETAGNVAVLLESELAVEHSFRHH